MAGGKGHSVQRLPLPLLAMEVLRGVPKQDKRVVSLDSQVDSYDEAVRRLLEEWRTFSGKESPGGSMKPGRDAFGHDGQKDNKGTTCPFYPFARFRKSRKIGYGRVVKWQTRGT
jgi:hypothetical protein